MPILLNRQSHSDVVTRNLERTIYASWPTYSNVNRSNYSARQQKHRVFRMAVLLLELIERAELAERSGKRVDACPLHAEARNLAALILHPT